MLDNPISEREVEALNSKSALSRLTRKELTELRAKLFDNSRAMQSMRGLQAIDAEIRWRDMSGYE